VRGLARQINRRRTQRKSGWSCLRIASVYESLTAGRCFYECFDRKDDCRIRPLLPRLRSWQCAQDARCAIDELGIKDRTILISPVGCSVFAYHTIVSAYQAAHGAPAVATPSSAAI